MDVDQQIIYIHVLYCTCFVLYKILPTSTVYIKFHTDRSEMTGTKHVFTVLYASPVRHYLHPLNVALLAICKLCLCNTCPILTL